jgi:hypothetical protein
VEAPLEVEVDTAAVYPELSAEPGVDVGMQKRRRVEPGWRAMLLAGALAILAAACGRAAHIARAAPPPDPLAAEIEHWSVLLRSNPAADETWNQVKGGSQPMIASAQQALRDGRRLLALQRLAAARMYLAASTYVSQLPPARRKDPLAFEAEWARLGTVLRADLGKPAPTALDGVQPAAVRAVGEAVLPQVRVYYDTSIEYGRNTMAQAGLFYLGVAQAQRDLVSLCRKISASMAGPAVLPSPPLRALGGELDLLEGELLAAYRPPAAIDRHDDFILASSLLNEARQLDAAGLRHGALLRYLQSAQRVALLRAAPAAKAAAPTTSDPPKTSVAPKTSGTPKTSEPLKTRESPTTSETPKTREAPENSGEALAARLRDLGTRLAADHLDHSLGRLFLESAQADLAGATAEKRPATAAVIAGDVLPRYFAALGPARPEPPRPAPEVTVTLVRWPYT